jgi:chromosome segregation ATPase
MKALQDKIKWLEEGNFRLVRELEDCEIRFRETNEAVSRKAIYWQEQLQAQSEQLAAFSLDKEHTEKQIYSLSRQIQQAQQILTGQETHTRVLQERITALERQVEQLNKENKLLEANLSLAEAEKARLQGTLRDLEGNYRGRIEEVEAGKEAAETTKNALFTQLQDLQKGTNRRNDDFQALLREANTHNQHLTSLLQAKDLQISNIQEELEVLKRAHLLSESARATLAQEAENARKLVYDLSISHDDLVQAVRSPANNGHKKAANSEEMVLLEREIKQLNEDYQAVLRRAESMDLRQLRGKLGAIADQTEAKNEQLAALRRKALSQA